MSFFRLFSMAATDVPTPPAGKFSFFFDSSNSDEPSYKDSAGVVTSLVGTPGQGVPMGGTTGQVLEKASGTDYDTQWATPAAAAVSSVNGDTGAVIVLQPIGVACSDETTPLTTGAAKATFRMPFAFTVTGVRASVTTAPTGSVLTVDINEAGVSILSTKITIDATEKTSTTAATPPVVSDSSLADDAEITIDIDTVGSSVAGTGLKVWLIGYAT